MAPSVNDPLGLLSDFEPAPGRTGRLVSLPALERKGYGPVSRLPVSLRIKDGKALLGKPLQFEERGAELKIEGGFELGLHPDLSKLRPGAGGAVAYWGVRDAGSELQRLLALGARELDREAFAEWRKRPPLKPVTLGALIPQGEPRT